MKRKGLCFLLTAVMATSVLPLFTSCRRGDKISDETRMQMSARTERAQFIPNAQTVVGETAQTIRSMRYALAEQDNVTETAFDVFDMERLLSELAVVEGNGAGKYLGYEVDEIKTEMYNMVSRAPWINEWFRVPRSDGGSDYFSDWAYLIENDLEYNFLEITRISWKTRASYYDSARGVEVEDYDGGSALQYNVMRTKYYMDEETEIVEVEMLDVMQAHDKDFLLRYQGLKNAKDKYFIKYDIEAMPRTLLGNVIDTNTPYGANRAFSYMSYGNSNFDLLQITQRYPNAYRTEEFRQYPAGCTIQMNDKKDGEYSAYTLTYDYDNELHTPLNAQQKGTGATKTVDTLVDLVSRLGLSATKKQEFENNLQEGVTLETALENLLGALSEKLVNEHELANEWTEIFKDSDKAKKEINNEIDLPIKVKYHYAETAQAQQGNLGDAEFWGIKDLFAFEVRGYLVPNPVFRNMTECKYYLAPAIMNNLGEIYYLPEDTKGSGNDFSTEHNIMWYGAWLKTERKRGSNALTVDDFKDFTVHGEYAVVAVLREKNKSGHLDNIYLVEPNYNQEFSFTIGETAYRFYPKNNQLRLQITQSSPEFEKSF